MYIVQFVIVSKKQMLVETNSQTYLLNSYVFHSKLKKTLSLDSVKQKSSKPANEFSWKSILLQKIVVQVSF